MRTTLRGRPIGLKAWMSKDQMKAHLTRIRQQWLAEGFSESEVTDAILSKCHPLLVGYYWARFPEASERLAEALKELGYPVGKNPRQTRQARSEKPQARKKAVATGSFALQFEEFLS
mgnify:CR=1 FL=1